MPAWWRPWKATSARAVGTARVGFVLAAEGEAAAGRGGHAADAEGREQRAARQAGHRYPDSAFAGASDSGSASASITTLRRRTWGLRSSV